ncbi:hypothetical protein BV22DRAFT_493211 [Leucogyrophana mollusca]|uniref:Uncharacterized protein n=1 Tax=Leucogyrophana mollusca TaxID=85980 RepID=A0ACB8BFN9_9AGAM|nr:hypothetical protein BV22DRAFT_493211 [Leucogyrophana mollusca]
MEESSGSEMPPNTLDSDPASAERSNVASPSTTFRRLARRSFASTSASPFTSVSRISLGQIRRHTNHKVATSPTREEQEYLHQLTLACRTAAMSTIQPFPLGTTDGAELLATFVSVALWGTTCMQSLIYFVNYPNDKAILKVLVVWLWLVDTTHETLIVEGVYTSIITDFCNYARIETVVPEYIWQVLLTSLVALPSQVFFTYRISQFSGRKWIFFALLAPLATFELAGGLAFIALGTITPTDQALVSVRLSSIFTAVQGTAAGVDITIAAGLVYLLHASRESALPRSRSILQKLMILSINTGIWTALFAIFTLITILAYKDNLIYVALYFPLCPLYCNTVLANLNARKLIRAQPNSSQDNDTFNLTSIYIRLHASRGQSETMTIEPTTPTKAARQRFDPGSPILL